MTASDYDSEGGRIAKDHATTMTWEAACGVDVTGWVKTNKLILSYGIVSTKHTPTAASFTLQWRNVTDAGSFTNLVSGSGELRTGVSAGLLVNNDPIGDSAGCESGTLDSESHEIDTESPYTTASVTGTQNNGIEFQFLIDMSNALDNKQYEFRLYDETQGSALSTTLAAQVTTEAGVLSARESRTLTREVQVWDRESRTLTREAQWFDKESRTLSRSVIIVDKVSRTLALIVQVYDRESRPLTRTVQVWDQESRTLVRTAQISDRESRTLTRNVILTDKESRTLTRTVVITVRESRTLTRTAQIMNQVSRTLTRSVILASKESRTLARTVLAPSKESRTLTRTVQQTDRESRALTRTAQISDRVSRTLTRSVILTDKESRTLTRTVKQVTRESRTLVRTAQITDRISRTLTRSAILTDRKSRTLALIIQQFAREPRALTRVVRIIARESRTLTRSVRITVRESRTLALTVQAFNRESRALTRSVLTPVKESRTLTRIVQATAQESRTLTRTVQQTARESRAIALIVQSFAQESRSLTRSVDIGSISARESRTLTRFVIRPDIRIGKVFTNYTNLLIELRKLMLDFVIEPKTVQLSDELTKIEMERFEFTDVFIGNEKLGAVHPYCVIDFDSVGAQYYTIGTTPGHNIPIKIMIFEKFNPDTEFIEKIRIFSYFNEIFINSVPRTLLNGTIDLITTPPEMIFISEAKPGVSAFKITLTVRKHRVA
ncbi:hypothetical protein LCGC14_0267200 [marine sediment metagenome]|uniref:Uncharacterized protein n=1 Tax=marine sediment metagenome TaxID=412755 RepID=A0A0F9U4L7_9ZZZZ